MNKSNLLNLYTFVGLTLEMVAGAGQQGEINRRVLGCKIIHHMHVEANLSTLPVNPVLTIVTIWTDFTDSSLVLP